MPLVILQKQFVPMVLSGEKRMTIRAIRKRRFKLGDNLYFYANEHGNSRKKLGEAKVVNVELVRVADTYGLPFIGQIVEWGNTFKGVKQL